MRTFKLCVAALLAVVVTATVQAGSPIRDQYIVVLDGVRPDAPVSQLAQALVARVGGGQVLHVYEHALSGFAVQLPAVAAQALAGLPAVQYVEQDQLMRLVDTQFEPPSYGLDRVDQRNLPLDQRYSFPAGAGSGAHVYIIDTGLRASHVDFAGRVGNGRNFAPAGGSLLCQLLGIGCPAPNPADTNDCNGHGTHVSGTSVGTAYGIAKYATVHPVRVFGCGNSTATSTIIAGVDWVSGNRIAPAVANMSLGGGASQAMDDAVRNLIAQGVSVAVAAGNESADACGSSPARVAQAITVGSTANTDVRSSFSNFGSCVDLFAPGSSIVSAGIASDTASQTLSGTSMASPHVAGAAARYAAANPGAAPAQLEAFLIGSATAGIVGNPGNGSPNRLLYLNPAGP